MRLSSKCQRSGQHPVKIVVITLLVGLVVLVLAACEPQAPPTTPTLQGAFVPTRSSPTPTATFTPTETYTPTFTVTPSATLTPSNTATSTPTLTPTFTATLTPTSTYTSTFTLTHTATLTPTDTPTPTATFTPTPTPTFTASATLTPVPSPSPETVSNVTPAPDAPIQIAYGETVGGTITNQQPRVFYVFTGSEGDKVNISMSAPTGELDPFLKLLNADGDELVSNDDHDSSINRDSYIGGFELPKDGEYTIVATRFDEEAGIREGDYLLTLTVGDADMPPTPVTDPTPAAATPEPADNVLGYGESITGTIDDDDFEVLYTFEGRAGDVVTITMLRNDPNETLDAYLKLLDPDDNLLTENDDAPALLRDSRIEAFELPEDGTYTIIATRFDDVNGTTTGAFTLILESPNATSQVGGLPTPTLTALLPVTQPLAMGTPIRATLSDQVRTYFFTFEGTQDQLIIAEMNGLARGLDPLLVLLAPDGRELIRNDDRTRFDQDSLIGTFRLPVTGTYTLIATSTRRPAQGRGDFEVLLNPGDPTRPTIGIVSQPLDYDMPTEIEFTQFTEGFIFTFSASAGDTIRLTFERRRTGLGIGYELTNPAATVQVGAGSENEITYTLPADGFYSLSVGARRGVGSVLVTLTKN